MTKVSWAAVYTWVGIWFVSSFIILDEELGIMHVLGLQPITWDAVADPRLFLTIFIGGWAFTGWWVIHWYRRKYGDLKPK